MTEAKKKLGRPKTPRDPEHLWVEHVLEQTAQEIPKVAGHSMTGREYDAFYLHSTGKPNKEIEEVLGYCKGALSNLKKTAWWKELQENFITEKQKDFHHKLALRNEEIEGAYFDIVNGKDTQDRTAQARMQGVRMYMEAGSDPLINRKASSVNITNSQIGSGNVKIDKDMISSMTQDEILEMALTGDVPEKVIKEVN